MSSHTISHADKFQAGNAVAFNKAAEFANNLRGLPITLMAIETFPGQATDADGIALSQTPAAGGQQDLLINGTLATDGLATLPSTQIITITSSGNDLGRTFTIIGVDANGRPQAEERSGPNIAAISGIKTFSKISRIFVDADTAGAITVGILELGRRGLRTKSQDFNDFVVAIEDGGLIVAPSFVGGSNTPQTAVNSDQRAFYDPIAGGDPVHVMYMPDLTKEGIGVNYTDPSQAVPSAI